MENQRRILYEDMLNTQLWENGYVVVPFLNHDELKNLLNIFNQIPRELVQGFYATAHSPDLDFRRRMSDAVKNAMQRSVGEHMVNCKVLGGSFIAKAPGTSDVLPPHQDWNIVDEEKFRSYNIWIPLVDLHEHNGVIMVMPGSHRWIKTYRHSSIPCAFQQVHSIILENMKPLYLKAGEALIYDHALLHASQPNRSNELRIACACGVIPEEAEMLFYWNHNGVIEVYESSPDFFLQENIFSGPHGLKKIKDIAYDFPRIDENKLYQLAGIKKPQPTDADAKISPKQSLSFFEIYSPMNILSEIKLRLSGKK
jgi:hypothetical protein